MGSREPYTHTSPGPASSVPTHLAAPASDSYLSMSRGTRDQEDREQMTGMMTTMTGATDAATEVQTQGLLRSRKAVLPSEIRRRERSVDDPRRRPSSPTSHHRIHQRAAPENDPKMTPAGPQTTPVREAKARGDAQGHTPGVSAYAPHTHAQTHSHAPTYTHTVPHVPGHTWQPQQARAAEDGAPPSAYTHTHTPAHTHAPSHTHPPAHTWAPQQPPRVHEDDGHRVHAHAQPHADTHHGRARSPTEDAEESEVRMTVAQLRSSYMQGTSALYQRKAEL